MIEFVKKPLPSEAQVGLRRMLKTPEFATLKTVIDSMALEHELAALKAALQTNKFENYSASANDSLANAIKLRECLKVLDEIKNRADPFELLKPINPG